jgi:PleD family two-component response regulator
VIRGPNGDRIPVTASFGVVQRGRGERVDTTIDRADRAMYRSKSNGRNRVSTDETIDRFPSKPTSLTA